MRLPWWVRQQSVCLQCERPRFNPWVGKIPWRRKWQPTPVLLPRTFHGLRSLVGYSPWGRRESDMTEQLRFLVTQPLPILNVLLVGLTITLSREHINLKDQYLMVFNVKFLLLLLSHFSRVRLCATRDGSPPGSPVPGILQARTLEWVAISFSNAWKWKVKVKSLSCVWLWATHGLQPTRLFRPWDFPRRM